MPLTPGAILGLLSSQSLLMVKYIIALCCDKIVALIQHFVSFETAGEFEYLAISGWGTTTAKNRLVLPFQKCVKFEVSAVKYNSVIQVVSEDDDPIAVETMFIIGADVNDDKKLLTYAKLFATNPLNGQEIVRTLIEKATLGTASELAIKDDLPAWITKMKLGVSGTVATYGNALGFHIYSSDIRRLDITWTMELKTAETRYNMTKEMVKWRVEEVEAKKKLILAKGEWEKMKARMNKEKLQKIKTEPQLEEADLELYGKIRRAEASIYQSRAQTESLKALAEGFKSMGPSLKTITAANDYFVVKDFMMMVGKIGQLKPNAVSQNAVQVDVAVDGGGTFQAEVEDGGVPPEKVDGGVASALGRVHGPPQKEVDGAGTKEVLSVSGASAKEVGGAPLDGGNTSVSALPRFDPLSLGKRRHERGWQLPGEKVVRASGGDMTTPL